MSNTVHCAFVVCHRLSGEFFLKILGKTKSGYRQRGKGSGRCQLLVRESFQLQFSDMDIIAPVWKARVGNKQTLRLPYDLAPAGVLWAAWPPNIYTWRKNRTVVSRVRKMQIFPTVTR